MALLTFSGVVIPHPAVATVSSALTDLALTATVSAGPSLTDSGLTATASAGPSLTDLSLTAAVSPVASHVIKNLFATVSPSEHTFATVSVGFNTNPAPTIGIVYPLYR